MCRFHHGFGQLLTMKSDVILFPASLAEISVCPAKMPVESVSLSMESSFQSQKTRKSDIKTPCDFLWSLCFFMSSASPSLLTFKDLCYALKMPCRRPETKNPRTRSFGPHFRGKFLGTLNLTPLCRAKQAFCKGMWTSVMSNFWVCRGKPKLRPWSPWWKPNSVARQVKSESKCEKQESMERNRWKYHHPRKPKWFEWTYFNRLP